MITVKLTTNPIKTAFILEFPEGTGVTDIVRDCKEKWKQVHERVAKDHSPYAMAFAEAYFPEYDDEASGDLTVALDRAIGKEAKPIAEKPKPAPKAKPKAVAPKVKPQVEAKVQKALSKAEQVRELIRSNPKSDADALITLAIDQLEMPKSRAKVYIKENLQKIRG